MIARVADHCFWFGRYVERAESTARVLATTATLSLDSELTPRQCWTPVIIVAGEEAALGKLHGEAALGDGERVQQHMTWTEDNPSSIQRSVAAARDNARSIREVVSLEAWEAINELHVWLGTPAAAAQYKDHRDGFYRVIRRSTQLCLGLLRSTMLHDTPLDFIWMGVLLERTSQTARLLDVHHHALSEVPAHQIVETALWLALLRACSGFEPFVKRHKGRVSARAIADFLVLEARFPRSVRYCVHSAYERLSAIRPPEASHLPGGAALERLRVLDAHVAERAEIDPAGLHQLLTHVVDEIHAVAEEIARDLLGTDAGSQAQSQ